MGYASGVDYDDLIRHYKTPGEASRKLKVTRSIISYWKKHGIPVGRQALIHIMTRGRLRADNPDTVPK